MCSAYRFKSNSFPYERFYTKTRFETEAQGNLEMAYLSREFLMLLNLGEGRVLLDEGDKRANTTLHCTVLSYQTLHCTALF